MVLDERGVLHDSLSDQANSTIVAVVDKGLVVPLERLALKAIVLTFIPVFQTF
jgi:hypothetical protein